MKTTITFRLACIVITIVLAGHYAQAQQAQHIILIRPGYIHDMQKGKIAHQKPSGFAGKLCS